MDMMTLIEYYSTLYTMVTNELTSTQVVHRIVLDKTSSTPKYAMKIDKMICIAIIHHGTGHGDIKP